MTDSHSDPLDPLDELASAALDGADAPRDDSTALDPESAQELADRVARLASVRDRLAAPVTPPADDVRDQMIARAVAAGAATVDAGASSTDTETAVSAPVRSLRTHRSRRSASLRRFVPIAAAAAVLLVIAIVTPTLLGSSSDDLASNLTDASSDADAGADQMTDTGDGRSTESITDQALAPDGDDAPAAAMEEDAAGAEAASDAEILIVPSPTPADREAGSELSLDELAREVSDEELLDAVIRYRSQRSLASPEEAIEDRACADVIDHPIDLVVSGSYRTQPAVFFAHLDGSAVLAVTVVDPTCAVLTVVTVD